jgi:predicted secreted protein
MARDPVEVLAQLRDERSGRVLFVSHCLLNENVRYAGGAFRPGLVDELVTESARQGWGLYQMPCPEQRARGGVLKRHMLRAYDSKGRLLYRFRRPLLRAFVWFTRVVYWRLARRVALDIADYQRSGFEVVGVVGVGASPSCGVATTLDLKQSLEVVASCPFALMSRDVMNERAVVDCRTAGEGLFVGALKHQLNRRGLTVPFLEHDLLAEMRGQPQTALDVRAA